MKTFRCWCGNILHFENTACLQCGRTLGYLPEHEVLTALEPEDGERWRALRADGSRPVYRKCRNYELENVCNWMVVDADPDPYCASCRLNHMIPDLSDPRNRVLWYRIERAKRRLLYTLYGLGLPVTGRGEDPERGLAFEFLADAEPVTEFSDDVGTYQRVMTGHRAGLITINVAEADPSAREQIRERMNEFYRTLLGHFRHESGHYYWDRLVRNSPRLEEFRALFGDERDDYEAALGRYYADGAPALWQARYVSAYAAAHPWEDWAETWAHYLHMVDTLETAYDQGFAIGGKPVSPPQAAHTPQAAGRYRGETPGDAFERLLQDWVGLTLSLNALNRSMGLPDAYPFVLSDPAARKLRFVHELVSATARV